MEIISTAPSFFRNNNLLKRNNKVSFFVFVPFVAVTYILFFISISIFIPISTLGPEEKLTEKENKQGFSLEVKSWEIIFMFCQLFFIPFFGFSSDNLLKTHLIDFLSKVLHIPPLHRVDPCQATLAILLRILRVNNFMKQSKFIKVLIRGWSALTSDSGFLLHPQKDNGGESNNNQL